MDSKKLFILCSVLMSIASTKALAQDIQVENADGKTIFYRYYNNGTELEVAKNRQYSGDLVIPEEVTYMNRTRKVTSIGFNAFAGCVNLTSITIPNSVTNLDKNAFSGCRGLKSITIPGSVKFIGGGVFFGWDMTEVISNMMYPSKLYTDSFSDNTFYNTTLRVPKGTTDKYKAAEGWKKFVFIEE